MRLLITGANGFVGRTLCSVLMHHKMYVNAIVRDKKGMRALYSYLTDPRNYPHGRYTEEALKEAYHTFLQVIVAGDLCMKRGWCDVLEDVHTVVHLAALVHQTGSKQEDSAYHEMNVEVTRRLAHAAVKEKVRRFIFMSSIKVNGECTPMEQDLSYAFTEEHTPRPHGPYGKTKWEGEQIVKSIANNSTMDYVILRPPLVYGAGVKGHLHHLLSLLRRGIPLPLKNIDNKRSIIFVRNLVDGIVQCISQPAAANGTFVLCDDECVSTPKLIELLCSVRGYPCHLFSFPQTGLQRLCHWMGKQAHYDRLTQSLLIDDTVFRNTLQWEPPYTLMEGLTMAFGEASGAC